jgi:predicted MFS family arabinose efflux permease
VALVGIANGLGTIVGPALGGALAVLGLTTPLWVAAGAALVTAGLVHRFLPEPPRVSGADQPQGTGTPLSWRDPRPRPVLLAVIAMFTALGLLSTTLGFLIQDRLVLDEQAASARTGAVLAAVGVGIVAAQVLVVQRIRPSAAWLLRGGLPIAGSGVLVLLIARTTPVFMASGLLMGLGAGLAISGAIAAATLRVGAGDQGTLGGLTVAAQVLGFVMGPAAGGLLYQQWAVLPGVVAVGLFGIVLLWASLADVARCAPDRAAADPGGAR